MDLDADARIEITLEGETPAITVRDAIPFGHKLAIRRLTTCEVLQDQQLSVSRFGG